MSKPGNFTAYQQYKPLDNGTIQAVQHWSGVAEQKRQNDIEADRRDKILQNQEEKDLQEEKDKWLTFPKFDTTGVADVDQFFGSAIQTINQERIKIVEKLQGYKKNSPEWTKEFIKLKKLDLFPEKFKTITNQQLQDGQKYAKEKDKTLVSTADNDNAFSNLRNPDIRLNPDTMEIGFVVKDPSDPTKTKVLTEQEMLNGGSPFDLIPKFNDTKWTQENIKLLNAKPPTYMDNDPATNKPILITGYDKEKAIKPYVQTTLFIEEEPTEQGLSFGVQLGYTTKQLKDPAIQEKIVNHYTDRLYSALTGGTKFDKDSANNKIQQQKADTDAAYKGAKISQGQQSINLKSTIAEGEGKIKTPVTLTDFKQLPKPDGKGRIGFNVVDNALVVSYGPKGNQVERKVTGVWINPKNKKEVKINYVETGKKPDAYGTAQPYSEKKTFDSTTDGEMAGTFSAEMGKTLEELHGSLMSKVPKPKAKPTSNKQDLRTKYKY